MLDRTGSNEKPDLLENYIHLKHGEYTCLFQWRFD